MSFTALNQITGEAAWTGSNMVRPCSHLNVANDMDFGAVTVVVADDSFASRLILTESLKFDGFISHEAQNGYEAIDLVNKVNPAVIILDLKMPDKDGWRVMAELKKLRSKTKICVVSASEGKDHIEKALAAGADDYLIKPILPEVLSKKVKNLAKLEANTRPIPCDIPISIVSGDKSECANIVGINETQLTIRFNKGSDLLYEPVAQANGLKLTRDTKIIDNLLLKNKEVQGNYLEACFEIIGLAYANWLKWLHFIQSQDVKGRLN